MKKRIHTLVVRVKSTKPVPDWGLGPGVITRAECTFTDHRGQGFDTYEFECALGQVRDQLIHEAVECYTESTKDL